MGGVKIKFYKIPFPVRYMGHDIRRETWRLKEKLARDRELKGKLLQYRVELEHLIMTGSKRKEDHEIAVRKGNEIRKAIREEFGKLVDTFRDQIRLAEKIDYRGQRIAFTELKSIKKFEKAVKGNMRALMLMELARLRKMKGGEAEKQRKAILARYADAGKQLDVALRVLDEKLHGTLKVIWSMAKRQAIRGIESEAILSSQHEDKEVREIKIEAKDIVGLVARQKMKITDLNRSRTLDDFMRNLSEVVSLFARELEDTRLMLRELRIFVYDLRGKFRILDKFAGLVEDERVQVLDLENHLKEALSDVETLYNWLFHEQRNYQAPGAGEWTRELVALKKAA
jgi:hypothetical protein